MDRCPDQMENCQLLSPEYSFFEQLSKKWNERDRQTRIQSLLVICSNVVLVESIKDLVGTLGLHRDKGEEMDANKLRKKERFLPHT
jgi:hypothetical protein